MSHDKGDWGNSPEVQSAKRAHKNLCDTCFKIIDWRGITRLEGDYPHAYAEWKDKNGIRFDLMSEQTIPNRDKPESSYFAYNLTRTLKNGTEEYYFFSSIAPFIDQMNDDGDMVDMDETEQVALSKKIGKWMRTCPAPDWLDATMAGFDQIIALNFPKGE